MGRIPPRLEPALRYLQTCFIDIWLDCQKSTGVTNNNALIKSSSKTLKCDSMKNAVTLKLKQAKLNSAELILLFAPFSTVTYQKQKKHVSSRILQYSWLGQYQQTGVLMDIWQRLNPDLWLMKMLHDITSPVCWTNKLQLIMCMYKCWFLLEYSKRAKYV